LNIENVVKGYLLPAENIFATHQIPRRDSIYETFDRAGWKMLLAPQEMVSFLLPGVFLNLQIDDIVIFPIQDEYSFHLIFIRLNERQQLSIVFVKK
jgi:hypothetical protein